MSLAAQQRDFMRSLFGDAEPAVPGLAVYRSSVAANLATTLEATYPVVRRLVGASFFAEAARRFALTEPSTSGDLADYGAGFASFLGAYAPAAPLEYVADVARLEWACHESARAPSAPAFDFESLAGVAPAGYEALRFTLHPAVRLVASAHPIAAIHEANAPERDGTPARTQGADHVVVRRGEEGIVVETVPAHEWRFLERLARGETLGEAGRALPAQFAEPFLATALARYVACAIVCGFTAP
jgi:hypothetical protein